MRERNGVGIGQRVRDLDGRSLGKVHALYDWGFAIRKGLPFLIRSDHVARYDEVRGVRDGELVLARSRRDLFDLAAGGVPATWRTPVPPGFPGIATPPEASLLRQDLARGAIATEHPPPAESPRAPAKTLSVEEEREHVRTRGQSVPAAPQR
jgi:hypothetical protein